ncbi:flocculation protein FLO11-like [Sitophilus oryzae]|uniref:Flocculation protein FLO11-like n=1 Tax=Sitophilus oryzae TaxID=7048 RepID=A0A6J2YTG6_SITOR|nr:flocculation protein FLO11-like [Sitophilus oryzae]
MFTLSWATAEKSSLSHLLIHPTLAQHWESQLRPFYGDPAESVDSYFVAWQALNRSRCLLWLYLLQFGLTVLSLEPGYLDFDNLPETNFTCVGKVIGGYYADLETNCQMFHVCTIGQLDEPMDIRFLCLNGTVFDQETRVCERIDEVDCSKSEQFYSLNLELYGNSGPILEESADPSQETESPSLIIKSTTPSTTTSTTSKRPTKFMNTPFFSTTRAPVITSTTRTTSKPNVISTHHFPVNPDIRFNPEEINISLNPHAPPDIRTKHFLSQSFSDGSKISVNSDSDEDIKQQVSSSTTPKTIYTLDIDSDRDSEVDFGFHRHEVHNDPNRKHQQQFLIQTNSFRHSQSFPPSDDFRNTQSFQSSTPKVFIHTPKAPTVHQHHHYTLHSRTEKPPQRVQIPIPLLPTLPPLIFSSPAPFTLQRHVGSKRFTKEHQNPPRIIISASASVSDASGRRLNYSLGTIDAAQILESPPSTYDEYKESDVVLDPFYHDVPKVKHSRRRKRSAETKKVNPFDIIKNEKEAVDVLKFLYTWYQSHQATATMPSVTIPVAPDLIHEINYNLSPTKSESLSSESSEIHTSSSKEPSTTEPIKLDVSELFSKNSRFSIVGGYKNIGSTQQKDVSKKETNLKEEDIKKGINITTENPTSTNGSTYLLVRKIDNADTTFIKDSKEPSFNPYDYVDDNYEGSVYKEHNSTVNSNTESVSHSNTNSEIKEKYSIKQDSLYNTNSGNKEIYSDKEVTLPNERKKVPLISDKSIFDLHTMSQYYKYFGEDTIDLTHSKYDNNTALHINDISSNNDTEALRYNTSTDIQNQLPTNNFNNITTHNITEYPSSSTTDLNNEPVLNKETISSTTTEVTSTTETKPSRRRGRIRQRPYNTGDSERAYSSSTTQFSVSNSSSRRGRKRGRSRFIDYSSTTSSTTAVPLTESNTETTIYETTLTTEIPTLKVDNAYDSLGDSSLPVTSHTTFEESSIKNNNVIENTHKIYKFDAKSESLPSHTKTETTYTRYGGSTETDITNIHTSSTTAFSTTTQFFTTTHRPRTTTENFVAKLFKYFAQSQRPRRPKSTTEYAPKLYNPVTEIESISTTETLPITNPSPIRYQSNTNIYNTSSSSAVNASNINLPTLRDVYNHTVQDDKITNDFEHKSRYSYQNTDGYLRNKNRVVDTVEPSHKKDEDVKTNLLYRLQIIEQNLSTKPINVDTNLNLDDTTATTPYLSYEAPESFGTTESSVTNPTKFVDLHDQHLDNTKQVTQSYHLSTESSASITPENISKYNYNLENDVFVVPELTTRSYQGRHPWKSSEESLDRYYRPENKYDLKLSRETSGIDSTTNLISYGSSTNDYISVNTATSPNVEIQKSISLPVSIFDSTFNIAHDVNNAQSEENDSSSHTTLPSTPNTFMTTEKLEEFIEEVEVTTKSVVAKEDHEKYTSTESYGKTITETVPTTFLTTEHTDPNKTVTEESTVRTYGVSEVGHNTTEILFIKNSDFERPDTTSTTNLPITVDMEAPIKVNSSHLLQVMIETTSPHPEEVPLTTTFVPNTRRTRPPRRKPTGSQRNYLGRHRFSTDLSTQNPYLKTEETNTSRSVNLTENTTDAPLYRSANPTRSELKKISLQTTPISSKSVHRRPTKVNRNYVFNCFGKDMNRFYADPRDCRLFHYCTKGYSKNQLLDLKYVCDRKTYFDEDKLICTKIKPERCI